MPVLLVLMPERIPHQYSFESDRKLGIVQKQVFWSASFGCTAGQRVMHAEWCVPPDLPETIRATAVAGDCG
ncbi:MAG: hypothetical protein ACOYJQ_01325 [Pseudochelatococcus sp.]|jgi:hypothetical protein